jgi:hypothetical protein
MPTAFVRYRSGGGFQEVDGYDYVFDSRKFLENGFYRDSGFNPIVLPEETLALTLKDDLSGTVSIGTGGDAQYITGTFAKLDTGIAATKAVYAQQPDEVSHTAPRQLSYYDTTLTFCADSDVSTTFTAADSTPTGTLVLTVADTSVLNGKNVTLSGADLPNTTFVGQIYIAVATSATTLVLQTAAGSAYVAWGDAGSGVRTISVVDKIAEFPWRDILGWSNKAPTR